MNAPDAPVSQGPASELTLLRRLRSLSTIGVWHWDLASERVTFSAELFRLHDLDPVNDLPPQDLAAALCVPEERAHLRALIARAIEHSAGWDCELPHVTARGRRLWLRLRGEPELHDGRCVALAGTCEDVTAQRELRIQARTAATRVRQLSNRSFVFGVHPERIPGAESPGARRVCPDASRQAISRIDNGCRPQHDRFRSAGLATKRRALQ